MEILNLSLIDFSYSPHVFTFFLARLDNMIQHCNHFLFITLNSLGSSLSDLTDTHMRMVKVNYLTTLCLYQKNKARKEHTACCQSTFEFVDTISNGYSILPLNSTVLLQYVCLPYLQNYILYMMCCPHTVEMGEKGGQL